FHERALMPTGRLELSDNWKFRKACDFCHRKHLACDRASPSCSSCSINQVPCTRERHFTYPSTRHQNVKTFSCLDKEDESVNVSYDINSKSSIVFKPYNPQKTKAKASAKGQSKSRVQLSTLSLRERNPSPVSQYFKKYEDDWVGILRKWYTFPATRRFFHYFTKLSGLSIRKSSSTERKFIIDTFANKMSVLGIERKVVLHLNISPSDTASMLERAKRSFFYYFNPFLPLFTLNGYESQARSLFLQFSVWRVGLQFITDSKLKDSLLEFIDNQLLNLLKPSALTFRLCSLQGIFILFMGKRESMHGMIQVLFFSLGLHSQSTTFGTACFPNKEIILERELARRIITYYFAFYYMSVGEPIFTFGYMTNERKNDALARGLFKKLERRKSSGFFGRGCSRQAPSILNEDGEIPCNFKPGSYGDAPYLDSEFVNWESLDCSFLYTSKYLNDEAVIMLEFNLQVNLYSKKLAVQQLEQTLGETLRKLQHLFFACIESLRRVQRKSALNSTLWFDEGTHLDSYTKAHFPVSTRFYHEGALECTQMIVFVVLRYHFSQLELLKAATRAEAEGKPANPAPSPRLRLSPNFIAVGLRSAVQIIRITGLLGNGPFLFMRYNFLFVASQFIIQYYHLYTSGGFLLQNPGVGGLLEDSIFRGGGYGLDLQNALRCAKKQLQTTAKNFATYQLKSLTALLNALLAYHDINIDP
ncbi:hypothetical protein L0F63_004548, partial [Massospora cicadina]